MYKCTGSTFDPPTQWTATKNKPSNHLAMGNKLQLIGHSSDCPIDHRKKNANYNDFNSQFLITGFATVVKILA